MSEPECREWVLHYDQADERGIPFTVRRCGDVDRPLGRSLLAQELEHRAEEMRRER